MKVTGIFIGESGLFTKNNVYEFNLNAEFLKIKLTHDSIVFDYTNIGSLLKDWSIESVELEENDGLIDNIKYKLQLFTHLVSHVKAKKKPVKAHEIFLPPNFKSWWLLYGYMRSQNINAYHFRLPFGVYNFHITLAEARAETIKEHEAKKNEPRVKDIVAVLAPSAITDYSIRFSDYDKQNPQAVNIQIHDGQDVLGRTFDYFKILDGWQHDEKLLSLVKSRTKNI